MLIPENGKWRWNNGPLCDTKAEALKTAKIPVKDEHAKVFMVDAVEPLEVVEGDEEDEEGTEV